MDRNTDPINLSDIPPKSLSARRAWIEINVVVHSAHPHKSLSARRAWIEIPGHEYNIVHNRVALRKESVDRNTQRRDFKALGLPVALRKESVDRNSYYQDKFSLLAASLSARRAWIEIPD